MSVRPKPNEPTFSVIIPTYNRAALIERAIRSVLAQTFRDFEVIVVDDGSTDQTRAVVGRIEDARLAYLYQPNRGVSAARNRGAAAARGQYLTFLDSDDEVLPGWLEQFVDALARPQVGLVCCGCIDFSEQDGKTSQQETLPKRLDFLPDNQTGLFRPPGVLALRRELFDAVGGYAEGLIFGENTELALRLTAYCTRQGWQIGSIPKPLVLYYKQPFDFSKAHTQAQNRLESVEYVLTQHRDLLQTRPRMHGNYRAVAGVCAVKSNQYRRARYHFKSAIVADPWNWKHYPRLLLALVPRLGHRFWSRHQAADQSGF